MQSNDTYTNLEEIGKGGGGIVYKALHTRLNKEVVIKQIINSNGGGIDNRTEVDLLKGLKHTYLPQVLDFFQENGETYTVMDFITGCDMDKYIKSGKQLTGKQILQYAIQLCEAVTYLHSRRPPIIHSDIKPGNIMLTDDGNICLIDFNVSLVFDEKNSTSLGGTVGYAPPEQLGIPLSDIKAGITGKLPIGKDKPRVDERSDIYSIGATLYFMLTGEKPAENYKIKPLSSFNVRISDGLLHIVQKAMSLNPAKRYKSSSEMLLALKNIGKLDKRYRALKIRREVATIVSVILLAAGFGLNRAGQTKLLEEHEEKYAGYLTSIKSSIETGELSSAEDFIQKAITMEPSRIVPYIKQEEILHSQKKYEECMAYPDSVLTPEILNNEQNTADQKAEMYVMAADSAFELENYSSAIDLYEKALFYSESLVDCYRDITISYARSNDITNAEISLQRARELGLSNDQLELMQGEICAQKGEYKEAFSSFEKALASTNNDYLRFRTLLVYDKTTQKCVDTIPDAPIKTAGVLESQRGLVSESYSSIVLEMLANEYFLCGKQSGDKQYLEKSADCYNELMNGDKMNRMLFKNYFYILTELEQFDRCIEMLGKMDEQFPNDYWVHMNYSYTYIEIENRKQNMMERDFNKANDEYNTAVKLYAEFTKNGTTDVEMDKLGSLIDEIKSWGVLN